MATQIVFIESPLFTVDFQPFIDAKKTVESSLLQKIQRVIFRPFELTGFIFVAVIESSCTTLSYSWVSFKHNVLGYYGSLSNYRLPGNFYLVMFKVIFWALGVAWCFAITALRRFIEQIDPPSQLFLTAYTEGKIDTMHLRTKELVIDVSHVPSEIKVDSLRTLFQRINFTDPNQPGYMAPSSRQEEKTIYTVEELEKSLEVFIKHVNDRQAFLGTPPAYDTPRLMAFYQQIENAVRFSIHKAQQDLENFQTNNGDGIAAYTNDQRRQYKNLLENQARIAIDMAIAGKHCGARYMGEAMSTYFSLKEEAEADGTLEDSLIELLAAKRSAIAQRHVYQHLGSDTHALSKYMATLGQPLGLPGTGNVVEHLRQDFDCDRFIRLFFQEYTVDLIIDAVQEKIKKSQLFREKITDWVKDQVGDWKKESENISEYIQQIQSIIDEKVEVKLPLESQQFEKLVTHLREKNVSWPSVNEWGDFIDELFALDETKEWLKTEFSKHTVLERSQIKEGIKGKMKALGQEEAQALKDAIPTREPLPLEATAKKEAEQAKIDKIRKILLLDPATILRILHKKVELETAVKDYLDVARRRDFLIALSLDKMAQEGASPALLEWLLVSQQILLPQEVR